MLTSATSKQVVLLELTAPWEDCIEEANERKKAKYHALVEEWRAECETIEVGCRGFAGQSLCRAYNMLAIRGTRKQRTIKEAKEAADVDQERRSVGRVALPGHKLGIDHPPLAESPGGERMMCERPETLNEPR